MSEISIYDDAVFHLMEELYKLNHKRWKKTILGIMAQGEKKNYKVLKEQLPEVPDLLVYRCIQELVENQVLRRMKEENQVFYILEQENIYIKDILAFITQGFNNRNKSKEE